MGFLDHLFKTKPSDEKVEAGEKEAGESEEAPDPGAFLRPKSFVPRGGTAFQPAHRTEAQNGRGAEHAAAWQAPATEIVLTLGDVLSRIPTQFLHAGLLDEKRELRFSIEDLSADIARGRAAVPLSKIAALCPDVFAREIAPLDDLQIRLPLQKLVEQIGLLRGRTAPLSTLRADSPAPPASPVILPPPPIVAEPTATRAVQDFPIFPAPATPEVTLATAILVHPPAPIRPVLVPPPTLLAAREDAPPPPPATFPHCFPQAALQALFATDDIPDPAAVCRHAAALPGVRACALDWHGETALGGDAPAGFNHAALHAVLPPPTVAALPIGTLENVTLAGDQASISIFARPGILLAALHAPLSPEIRDRLTALADLLARGEN